MLCTFSDTSDISQKMLLAITSEYLFSNYLRIKNGFLIKYYHADTRKIHRFNLKRSCYFVFQVNLLVLQ